MITKEMLPREVQEGDVICLCGSTKFKDVFLEIKTLCMDLGAIVLTPEVYGHSDELDFSTIQAEILRELHYFKIGLSDYVIIINIDGYIGESTLDEIDFANEVEVPVYYLEENNA